MKSLFDDQSYRLANCWINIDPTALYTPSIPARLTIETTPYFIKPDVVNDVTNLPTVDGNKHYFSSYITFNNTDEHSPTFVRQDGNFYRFAAILYKDSADQMRLSYLLPGVKDVIEGTTVNQITIDERYYPDGKNVQLWVFTLHDDPTYRIGLSRYDEVTNTRYMLEQGVEYSDDDIAYYTLLDVVDRRSIFFQLDNETSIYMLFTNSQTSYKPSAIAAYGLNYGRELEAKFLGNVFYVGSLTPVASLAYEIPEMNERITIAQEQLGKASKTFITR